MPEYMLEKLSNEPIVVFTVTQNFSVTNDSKAAALDRKALLDTQPGSVYCIMDYSEIAFDFEELVESLNRLGRGANSLYHHPKIAKLLIVAPSPVLKQAFHSMAESDLYGHLESLVFDSLAEALEYARSGQ